MKTMAESFDISPAEQIIAAKKKKRIKKICTASVNYFFLVVIGIALMFPALVMLLQSFMTRDEAMSLPAKLFPDGFQISNYLSIFESRYLLMFGNTFKIVLINLLAVPLTSSLCAYAFARLDFKGRELIFAIVLATMMLPGVVTQIPTYILYSKIGLLNTHIALWLPSFGGGAVNIFLVRQFMRGIPKEIDNAAKIDGANRFRIYWNIVLPMTVPVLIYIGVAVFTATWNDFQGPLMYLSASGAEKYTLSLGLYYDFGKGGPFEIEKQKQMAIGVVMSIFPAVLFLVFQRYLIEGVSMGAVKG